MGHGQPGVGARLTAHALALAILAVSSLGGSLANPGQQTATSPSSTQLSALTEVSFRPLETPLPGNPTAAAAAPTQPAALPSPSAAAVASLAGVRPNELGQIMVLEYHQFGDEEERWTRTWANFREDLEYLYRNGYRMVGLNDLLDNRVRVPAGKTPVVLTFDDSNRTQFQFVKGADGELRVDPESALGILEAFRKQHPDFGTGAVFCVLPGADPPNDLFGQEEYRQQKLKYLVQQGHEICNHTLWHANLAQIDDEEIVRQLGLTNAAIQEAVPGYKVNVFNPPFGVYPNDTSLVVKGTFEGSSYHHRAILRVSGGAAHAPNHRDTDFLHLPRIQAIPEELERWFTYFEEHPEDRYVSDGDPDQVVFPRDLSEDFKPAEGMREIPSPDDGYRMFRLR